QVGHVDGAHVGAVRVAEEQQGQLPLRLGAEVERPPRRVGQREVGSGLGFAQQHPVPGLPVVGRRRAAVVTLAGQEGAGAHGQGDDRDEGGDEPDAGPAAGTAGGRGGVPAGAAPLVGGLVARRCGRRLDVVLVGRARGDLVVAGGLGLDPVAGGHDAPPAVISATAVSRAARSSPDPRATTAPPASTATRQGSPVSPAAWAAAWSPSTGAGDVQPSASSQRAGGWLGRRGATAVDTPNRSTPSGSPPLSTQSWMTGTSAWQWGHQWARNTTMAGRPAAGRVSGRPSRPVPLSVGIGLPIAGSSPSSVRGGSGSPSTVAGVSSGTAASVKRVPSSEGPSSEGAVSRGDVAVSTPSSSPEPAIRAATRATTTTATTTAATTATARSGRPCPGLGRVARRVEALTVSPGGGPAAGRRRRTPTAPW